MHTPDSGDPPNTLTEAELSTGRDPSIPSALISCIYWADRDDYFITSVDILLLMEFLSSSEFPFEEKSRTRRNLEAYRPITVARRIPPTVPFFHLLMTYPEPRPRKIEKDIKIYRWADLPRAIPKIMARE
ncbi:MAG: hypothetical protein DHS80DRAFT_13979 [Piptocephalis tieghemiana]|nr:MAG: hypothetical protein DHS80DRAFT_13979 [Piptocephalis tieghemiana]